MSLATKGVAQPRPSSPVAAVLQGQGDTGADQGGVGEPLVEHAGRGVARIGAVRLRVAAADAGLRAGDVSNWWTGAPPSSMTYSHIPLYVDPRLGRSAAVLAFSDGRDESSRLRGNDAPPVEQPGGK
ncbi:hypothetical protein [Streptomyces sp. NPDC018584]|uniref:hypothetical protein n=1 Tax=unclassified Streptomyces TaxID=2593676 RepID=UPI00379DB3CC